MAVYTDVGDDALTEFLSAYDLGAVLAFKGIAEGVENSNFYLKTEAGSFILTLYEKRVREEQLPFFLNLMEHLAAHGISCPQPIRNRSGTALGHLAGRPAALVSFLEGLSVKSPTAVHCRALGGALAALHIAGTGFSMTRPNDLSLDAWRPLLEASGSRADTVTPDLKSRLDQEVDFLERHWPRDLPTGVIHADLFTDNVFFLGEQVSGIIDFYFACTDALAYDLAICLNAWCFEADNSYNLTKGRAMIGGYQAVRPLDQLEIDAFPVLCRGSAMRFCLTRLYDWLNVPPGAMVHPKDPLEYDRKVAFHRHIVHASEYGFLS
ncbi:MAG: homoserine kinase [Methylobacteriaceae bacterium]|jgi:homoserine kinase type II|nr:homoserine kinase [Methylobacteriaceae bacterium]